MMKTVCVSGHRPAKLPWKYTQEGPDFEEYIEALACTIDDYIKNGYEHFISGMALGVDMDFAEIVLDLKRQYGFNITFECAIPCPNQTAKWPAAQIVRYEKILAQADTVTMVNDHYFRACMLVRNEYIVDKSDTVLAVWNGIEEGGTWQTIKYAKNKGKIVDVIRVDTV